MRTVDQLGAAALTYATLGYRVLPLHHPVSTNANRGRGMLCSCGDPACGAVGKHPLTAHGLKDATSDPAQLGRMVAALAAGQHRPGHRRTCRRPGRRRPSRPGRAPSLYR